MTKCTDCTLKSIAAKTLNSDELDFMDRNCAEVVIKKGENIIREGSLSSHISYIKNGLAKVHMKGPSGKEQILKLASSGSYIGIQTILAEKIHRYSATCIDDSTICIIDITSFRELISRNAEFANELIIYLCRDELSYFERFVALSQKQINGRLADALISISSFSNDRDEFILPLTRSELASLTGVTRESVTRALRELVDAGIISLDKRNIKIRKFEMLEEISRKG